MVGLIHLIYYRPDLPIAVRDAIRDNHRYEAALAALEKHGKK